MLFHVEKIEVVIPLAVCQCTDDLHEFLGVSSDSHSQRMHAHTYHTYKASHQYDASYGFLGCLIS